MLDDENSLERVLDIFETLMPPYNVDLHVDLLTFQGPLASLLQNLGI